MKKTKLTERFGVKMLAWFLLALSILGLMISAVGIVAASELNVYSAASAEELKQAQFVDLCVSDGDKIVRVAAVDGQKETAQYLAEQKNAEFRLLDQAGAELWKSAGYDAVADSPFQCTLGFRKITEADGTTRAYCTGVKYQGSSVSRPVPEPTPTPVPTGKPTPSGKDDAEKARPDGEAQEKTEYLLEAVIDPGLPLRDAYYWTGRGLDLLWAMRYAVYALAGALLLLGAVCFIFLLCAAGHRAGREGLTPGYLTRVPFDLLTAVTAFIFTGMIWLIAEATRNLNLSLAISLACAAILALALLFAGWCTSLALRVKLGKWWENTIIFRLLRLVWRGLCAVFHGIGALLRGLPLIWRTVLLIIAVSVLELLAYFGLNLRRNTECFLSVWFLEKLLLGGFLLYLALMLRKLQKGGTALASGDLRYLTDTRAMFGDFRRHGENLNSIAAGMSAAVERQMKSERMKTELITNVSHDIKTPLTSIINYVDLLKTASDPVQREEYIAVLDRQSNRLKKLTEDLVEVSKASTGNIEVAISRHSVNELLRQALGEYSERLAAAGLEPVLFLPETELFAGMDGTLMWRVLDNLLSNVCKYAQSGTRLYVDALEQNGFVIIRFKNISRDPLNISAEELMERFVRGDRARSSEGSGLGLSIARSLTELQHGSFYLSVDGDLFKVDLVFQKI